MIVAAFALFLVPVAAIAAGGFTDVDDDSVFVADIQWMKDNGITKGCNPPTNDRFCPGSNVTREQMSAFMHRLAVSKVVDAATAVEADNAHTLDGKDSTAFLGTTGKAADSDKLDGSHAADIAPIAVAEIDTAMGGVAVSEPTTLNAVTITVPTDGVLIIAGGAYIRATENGLFGFEVYVGRREIGDFTAFDEFSTAGNADPEEFLSYTTTAAVTAGTYVVSQQAGKLWSTGDLIAGSFVYNSNSLTVTFIPGGTVSASTAGAVSAGSMDGS